MKTIVKLFLMTHHLPVTIGNQDAFEYYRAVARLHGYSLVHCSYGWIMQ